MNIIEALQALKDGKKICRTGSFGGLYTCLSPTGMIVDQDGNPNPFTIDCIAALVEEWYSWKLYDESSQELTSCPLCKGEASIEEQENHLVPCGHDIKNVDVYCIKCGITISRKTREEAIVAWNRRV